MNNQTRITDRTRVSFLFGKGLHFGPEDEPIPAGYTPLGYVLHLERTSSGHTEYGIAYATEPGTRNPTQDVLKLSRIVLETYRKLAGIDNADLREEIDLPDAIDLPPAGNYIN